MLHLQNFTCWHPNCCDMLGTAGWTIQNRRRATIFRAPPVEVNHQPSCAQRKRGSGWLSRYWLILFMIRVFSHVLTSKMGGSCWFPHWSESKRPRMQVFNKNFVAQEARYCLWSRSMAVSSSRLRQNNWEKGNYGIFHLASHLCFRPLYFSPMQQLGWADLTTMLRRHERT